jgi:DNA polymerase III subunit epsilon
MQPSKRKVSIRKARELLLVNPLFLDTETTGLGSDAEIVEVAIIDSKGNSVYESLVKPSRKIPRDAVQIHGITDQMVQDAPKWSEIWFQINDILLGRYTGIYNADFDLRMMKQTHSLSGLSWSGLSNTFCIMKLYADFYPYGGGRYQKLEDAGRQCGLSLPNSHRARDDSLLALAIFNFISAAYN